jgi:DNA-binding response OmpR family regulator
VADFFAFAESYSFSLYILDLGLPDGSGRDIIRRLRAAAKTTPIMVLTARAALEDRVLSLDCGADDYVIKPVHPKELTSRVRALLRRPTSTEPLTVRAGELVLDCSTGGLSCLGARLQLARSEQRLLALLMRRCGRPVAREAIENALIGADRDYTPNATEKLVSRLRKSLEDWPSRVAIKTLRGVGYVLEEIR